MSASNAHPDELLASLVDGALSAAERAEVEGHLATCTACREELALARRAAAALASLEEADVPAGLTSAIVHRARGGPGRFSRAYWAVGATAAAAAVVVLGLLLFRGGGGGGLQAAAPAGGAAEGAARLPVAVSTVNYDPKKILRLADTLASGKRSIPPPVPVKASAEASGTGRSSDTGAAPVASGTAAPGAQDFGPLVDPRPCLNQATGPLENDRLIEIIQARFEGKPAYIAAYKHAPGAAEPPNLLTIWVAARPACTLLHYASQPLG